MTWRERRRRRAELDKSVDEHLRKLADAMQRVEETGLVVLERVEEMNERTSRIDNP